MAKRLIPTDSYVMPVIMAVLVHILIFSCFFWVWTTNKEIPVASKPMMIAQLYELQSQSPATTQTAAKVAGESDKTRAQVSLDDQMATRREEQEKAAAQKAAVAAKVAKDKADAAKAAKDKADAAKVAKDKADAAKVAKDKADAAKVAKDKADAAKVAKDKADVAKVAKDKADAAKVAKDKADAAKVAKDKADAAKAAKDKTDAAAIKAKEDKEAQALAELIGDKPTREVTKGDRVGPAVTGGLNDLIAGLIKANWTELGNPTKNTSVELLIEMMPDGTITKVSISRGSGNAAFDTSALAAANNVGRVPQVQQLDRDTFEELYRKFRIVFKPKD